MMIETSQVTTSFLQIAFTPIGSIRIWYLKIGYIAVDRNFPHHFNTFDSVPLDYLSPNIFVIK